MTHFIVFEGYQIYQLKDATVSAADIDDANKSRLVAQCRHSERCNQTCQLDI